jgi:hypothetical protein
MTKWTGPCSSFGSESYWQEIRGQTESFEPRVLKLTRSVTIVSLPIMGAKPREVRITSSS